MHSRMRYRVSEFQKVLNRAKTEVATTERKTVRYGPLLFPRSQRSVDLSHAPLLVVVPCDRHPLLPVASSRPVVNSSLYYHPHHGIPLSICPFGDTYLLLSVSCPSYVPSVVMSGPMHVRHCDNVCCKLLIPLRAITTISCPVSDTVITSCG